MVIVDVSANLILCFTVRECDSDFVAVRDAELLFVMGINEPNAASGLLDMTTQPVPAIAVAVKVVFSLVRIQTKQIGILRRIHTDAIVVLLGAHLALRVRIAVFCQCASIMENVAFFPERVDNLIKLFLEFGCFEVSAVVIPRTEKAVSVRIHIRTEMPDQPALHTDLRTLPEGVFILFLSHSPFFKFHEMFPPYFLLLRM